MLKYIFLSIVTSQLLFAASNPNEEQIFYHVHQATRWAELMVDKNCPFSDSAMEKHLSEIKYKNPQLVKSIFYKEYIYLRNHLFEKKRTITQIEQFRSETHKKAERLKIKHPEDWQSEFLACANKI